VNNEKNNLHSVNNNEEKSAKKIMEIETPKTVNNKANNNISNNMISNVKNISNKNTTSSSNIAKENKEDNKVYEKSFDRLLNLQRLLKKESALKELCKLFNFLFFYYYFL
jgi:hypothetical protein